MKLVVIESPYAGLYLARNLRYAKRALRDSFSRNEAPYASHLLYPQVISEENERRLALTAAQEFVKHADLLAVYTDNGISPGMEEAIRVAQENNVKIEYRRLD